MLRNILLGALTFLMTSPIYAGITGKITDIDFQPNGDLIVSIGGGSYISTTDCTNNTEYILAASDNPTPRQKAFYDSSRATLLAAFASQSTIQITHPPLKGCLPRSTDGAPFSPIYRLGLKK